MQFKSFPVTFLMRHGTRALRDGAFSPTPFTYMIPLAMGMSAMGALSLQLGEIANGNNPLTMWDDDDPDVALSFMTKAMMKGGGMTLLGILLQLVQIRQDVMEGIFIRSDGWRHGETSPTYRRNSQSTTKWKRCNQQNQPNVHVGKIKNTWAKLMVRKNCYEPLNV